MRLGGKVAIVTGAGSGIGRAIALEFAREGARVVVAELDTAPCHQSTKTLLEAGGEAIAVQTDVSNDASARRLVETAVTQFGPPDVLVNNAAIMPMGGGGYRHHPRRLGPRDGGQRSWHISLFQARNL